MRLSHHAPDRAGPCPHMLESYGCPWLRSKQTHVGRGMYRDLLRILFWYAACAFGNTARSQSAAVGTGRSSVQAHASTRAGSRWWACTVAHTPGESLQDLDQLPWACPSPLPPQDSKLPRFHPRNTGASSEPLKMDRQNNGVVRVGSHS
jgi:hypothetical protein